MKPGLNFTVLCAGVHMPSDHLTTQAERLWSGISWDVGWVGILLHIHGNCTSPPISIGVSKQRLWKFRSLSNMAQQGSTPFQWSDQLEEDPTEPCRAWVVLASMMALFYPNKPGAGLRVVLEPIPQLRNLQLTSLLFHQLENPIITPRVSQQSINQEHLLQQWQSSFW